MCDLGRGHALCRNLGGHQVTITSPEENDFVDQLLVDCGRPGPFIGLHRQNGQTTWETAEPVRFTKFCDLLAARGQGEFGFIRTLAGCWLTPGPWRPSSSSGTAIRPRTRSTRDGTAICRYTPKPSSAVVYTSGITMIELLSAEQRDAIIVRCCESIS